MGDPTIWCAHEGRSFPKRQFGEVDGVWVHKQHPFHTTTGDMIQGAVGRDAPLMMPNKNNAAADGE